MIANRALALPRPLHHRLEALLARLLQPAGTTLDDFRYPDGEPALTPPDSVSWAVFKNPLSLFIGGVAAVTMQLAEPRVRSGVWEHTSFRERPLERLQRTGYAAMMTVYGPRSRAEPMIARVTRLHAGVRGLAPDGRAYCATDPELLDWVQATSAFGFMAAYHRYVRPLGALQRSRLYEEGLTAAGLYGATSAPRSEAAVDALFERMRGRLEPSDIVFEFLHIMRRIPALPPPLRSLQGVLIEAAVQTLPAGLRSRLGLTRGWELPPLQRGLVCRAAAAADRLVLASHPAVQACRRLGLPDDHLYAGTPGG